MTYKTTGRSYTMLTIHGGTKKKYMKWPLNENDAYTASHESLQPNYTDQEEDSGKDGQVELQTHLGITT